ncbi:MAG: PAS domain S-box protein [bacterium]|nr:PAS domain S-box protein [bacterium]
MINDKDKSKEELIRELENLRKRFARLENAGDIEYKRIEGELKKSEQLHRTVFQHSPDYIYLNDVDGFFLDANPATLEVHGLSLEEFQKKSFLDFFAGDNLEELIRVSEDLKEGRPVFGLKLRTRTVHGQILELEINAVPLFEDGKVVSVLSLARDITARVNAEAKLKQAYDEMETRVTMRTVELVKANQELRSEIAERQRAEKALRESEELYRTLMETNPDMVLVADLGGRIMAVSRNTLKIMQLEKMEDIIGHQTFEFIAPLDHEAIVQYREKLIHEGSYRNVEITYRRKDGTTFVEEVNVSLLKDANGEPWGLIGVGRDVTERKQAEAARQESEELYRTLVETSPNMIGLLDLEGRIRFMNRRLKEAHGVKKEEDFIGKKVTDLMHPADREKAEANIRRANRGEFNRSNEYSIHLPDGSLAIWETTSALIRDAGGRPKAILAINRDVTEQRKAENALRESEELYRTLVETLPDVITVMDLEGRVIYASPKMFETYGYKSEKEFLGKKFSELTIAQDRGKAIANFRKAIQEGSMQGQEYKAFRKDGTSIIVESRSSVLRDAAGNPKALMGITRDVTERKRSETALRESEERYRTLVETSPEAVFVTDLKGRIKEVSRRALEIMGAREKKDLIGKPVFDFTDSREHAGIKKHLAKILKSQVIRNMERVIKRIDGTTYFGEVSASLLRDDRGNPKELLVTIHDVTERKRAEMALKESEEMYRTLIETSPDVIAMLDMEGRITYATGKIYEMYGYKTEKEFLGKKALDFVSPKDRERAGSNLMKSARLGSLRGNEYPILRKDGKVIVTEVSSALIKDAHGRPKGMIAINRDVTERKRAEEALKESEELYRTLVETSPDAIVSTDLKMRITAASQRALELFGADKKEDLIGKVSLALTDPKDYRENLKNINKIFKGKVVRNVEQVFSRIKGTNFIGEANAALLKDASGNPTGFLASIRDITERKRMEKEILEIAARERRRIGHDLHDGLGQHLAAISFMNKVLENKLAAKCPSEAREAAKISKLISEAITQSRDLSRGVNPVEPRADGLMVSLRQLSANLERIFKVSCAFLCPRRVLVDDNIVSTNLYYIAQEATSNAIKHGKAGQIKIRLAVVRNKLTLSVSDNGVGIQEDFKINRGLGLQIMDYRAKIIGASLNIQPGRKSGTTVTCSLRVPAKVLN